MFHSCQADFLSSGVDLVMGGSTPQGQSSLIKDQALPFLFESLSKQTIGEFPFEGGKLKNIQIQLIPPKTWDKVNVDIFSDTLSFRLGGLGAKIGADFEVLIKKRPATGHMDIDITDLGIDLKLKNKPNQGTTQRQVGADIKLDLEHTHADVRMTATGDIEEIKAYLFEMVKKEATSSLVPSWAQDFKFWAGRGAIGSIDYAILKKTQEVVDHYFNHHADMSDSRIFDEDIPATIYKSGGKVLGQYMPRDDSHLLKVDSVKDRLIRNGNTNLFNSHNQDTDLKNQLMSSADHVQQHSDKIPIEYKVSSDLYSKLFLGTSSKPVLNKDMVKQLLDRDTNLSQKVESYFGDKVQFDCQPTSKEPQLKSGKGDSIIGTYTVRCQLRKQVDDPEPTFSMDYELEFVIHPDRKSEGKPSDKFGEFVNADMGMTPDGKMKTTVRVSDEPEPMAMFPGFADLFGDLFKNLDDEVHV